MIFKSNVKVLKNVRIMLSQRRDMGSEIILTLDSKDRERLRKVENHIAHAITQLSKITMEK